MIKFFSESRNSNGHSRVILCNVLMCHPYLFAKGYEYYSRIFFIYNFVFFIWHPPLVVTRGRPPPLVRHWFATFMSCEERISCTFVLFTCVHHYSPFTSCPAPRRSPVKQRWTSCPWDGQLTGCCVQCRWYRRGFKVNCLLSCVHLDMLFHI